MKLFLSSVLLTLVFQGAVAAQERPAFRVIPIPMVVFRSLVSEVEYAHHYHDGRQRQRALDGVPGDVAVDIFQ